MVALLTVARGDRNRNLLFFLLLWPIFTFRLVCHGETLVKLQTVSHQYNFLDSSKRLGTAKVSHSKNTLQTLLSTLFWDFPTGKQNRAIPFSPIIQNMHLGRWPLTLLRGLTCWLSFYLLLSYKTDP